MQAQAKILDKSSLFVVQTKHDKQRIEAISVSGHRVLVTLGVTRYYHAEGDKEREDVYPAGIGLMYNGEQKIYQIFPGGMYDMLRSRSHSSRGERYDAQDMREMRQLTFEFVGRLRTWAMIGEDGRSFTDTSLRAMALELDHPKRNERKLKASEHFHKASSLRNKNDRRMPMPAAFTAAAGAQQLDRRREDVKSILTFLDPERVRLFGLVDGVRLRIEDAWREFSPEKCLEPGHAVTLAAHKPTEQSIKVMRDRLRPVYRGLREIKARPLNGLADEAALYIATIGKRIKEGRGPVDIVGDLINVRAPLAAALIVHDLQMELLAPLSSILARWNRLDAATRRMAVNRTVDAILNFGTRIQARHLHPVKGNLVMEHVRSASFLAANGDEDIRRRLNAVKKTLKRLSEALT